MDLSLKGKNALVCGGSKGIGKAAAMELAKLGANITLVSRSYEILGSVSSQLHNDLDQKHDFLVADFSDTDDLRRKIKLLLAKKTIHVLINNTGGPAPGNILDASPEDFLSAINNHLICNQLLAQLIVPYMKKEGYGRIINVISTSVKAPIHGLGVSNTTRGAVASWAKTLSNEIGQFGITVNNVLPGFTATGRLDKIIDRKSSKAETSKDQVAEQMMSKVPMRRFADPHEIGNVIAFLASPAASYVNGTSLRVDGGRTPTI